MYNIIVIDDKHLLYQTLGDRIRRRRENLDPFMSQAQLAKRVGVTRVSIVNIEAGRQCAPLHLLWEIAAVLGTEVTMLIPRRDEFLAIQSPLKLDDRTVKQIEEHANGDFETKRRLTDFVRTARSRALSKSNGIDRSPQHAAATEGGASGAAPHDAPNNEENL